jgi:N-methylhydantoinase A/oxoprolinase/acetone carboxylase beta subunit
MVVDRSALEGTVAGPAIINQMDTTTLVPPGWQARRIGAGALVLQRAGTQESSAP